MFKKALTLVLVALLHFVSVIGQPLNFEPDVDNKKTSYADINAWLTSTNQAQNFTGPYTLPTVTQYEYDYLAGIRPVPVCHWDHEYKSLHDLITVRIDKDVREAIPAYKLRLYFNVTLYTLNSLTQHPGGNNISGAPGSFSSNTLYGQSIDVTYDPASGATFQDLGVLKFAKAFKMDVTLVGVYNTSTAPISPMALSNFPKNLIIESKISSQRIDITNGHIPTISSNVNNGSLNLGWGFPCQSGLLGMPVPKSVAYDLEWAYVDDYHYDPLNGAAPSNLFATQTNSISYDFAHNATRVRTYSPFYAIPLVYQRGAIIYRVRTVSPNPDNYEESIYSDWSLPPTGAIAVNDPNINQKAYIITAASVYSNDHMNWQYSISFAEEGKFKHVINFYDGSLKNRQTQTKINTDYNYVVAVDHAFDYEGRPAVTSLPTPLYTNTGTSQLMYDPYVLAKPNGQAIQASDFDSRGGSAYSCPVPAQPMAGLNSTSKAELYYSSGNPDQNDMQQFVPKSEGYPYSMTVLSPGDQKKVLVQGGPGPKFQIGQDPNRHFTQYDYSQPTQAELDKVLGTEAGQVQYYPKVVATDPNKQSSFTIYNKYGKPVISGLSGDNPGALNMLDELSQMKINPAMVPSIRSNLLKNVTQDRKDGIVKAEQSFGITNANTPTTLKYNVTVQPFLACGGLLSLTPNIYLQTKATVKLQVSDPCGVSILSPSSNVSGNTFSQGFGSNIISNTPSSLPQTGSLIIPNLNSGEGYSLKKELVFDKADVESVVKNYIASYPSYYGLLDHCSFTTEKEFIKNEIEKIVQPCEPVGGNNSGSYCEELKQKMKEDLLPDGKYSYHTTDAQGNFQVPYISNSIFSSITIPTPPQLQPVPGASNGFFGQDAGYNGPCNSPTPANYSYWSYTGGTTFTHGEVRNNGTNCDYGLKASGFVSASTNQMFYKTKVWVGTLALNGHITLSVTPFAGNSQLTYGGSVIHTIKVNGTLINYNNHWDHPFGIGPSGNGTYDILFSNLNLGWNDIEIGICNFTAQPGGISSATFAQVLAAKFKFTNTCSSCGIGSSVTMYRYQLPCITGYPSLLELNGVYYGNSSGIYNGQPVYDIHSIDPATFWALYNAHKEEIAEALLVLHPEYCSLKDCNDAAFLVRLGKAVKFEQAEATIHPIFKLVDGVNNSTGQSQDGLVGNDPLYINSTNRSDMYDRLTHLPGYKPGYSYGTGHPMTKTLDQIAREMAYCGAGNKDEQDECKANLYASYIQNGQSFINNDIKQKYWENLRNLFLATHNHVKSWATMNASISCGPCGTNNQALSITGNEASAVYFLDPSKISVSGYFHDAFSNPEIDMNDLYGISSENSFTDILQNPISTGTTPNATFSSSQQQITSRVVEDFLAPIRDFLTNATVYGTLKNDIITRLTSNPQLQITPSYIDDWLVSHSIQRSSICNAYLLNYNLITTVDDESDPYTCADESVYADLRTFANALLTASQSTPASISLSATDPFQKKIHDILAGPGLGTISASVSYSNIPSSYQQNGYWRFTLTFGSAQTQVFIYPLAEIASPTISMPSGGSITGAYCINGQGIMNRGLNSVNTALMTGANGVKFLIWSSAPVMTVSSDPEFAKAVNCWDINQGIQDFINARPTYQYAELFNDPLYITALTNFLNYKFKKNYLFNQYEDLMRGCAVSDYFRFRNEYSYKSISFSSVAAGNNFTAALTASGNNPATEELRLSGNMAKFRYTLAGGTDVMHLDFSQVPKDKIFEALNTINLYAQWTGGSIQTPITSNIAASVLIPATVTTSFSPAISGLNVAFPVSVSVANGSSSISYNKYDIDFSSASLSPKQESDAIVALDAYLTANFKGAKVIYNREVFRSKDYASPKKQAYLSYLNSVVINNHAESIGSLEDHNTALRSALGASLYGASYKDPLCIGGLHDLYVFPSNSAVNGKLVTALSGYSQLVSNGTITAPISGGYRRQFKKANGAYWFTYIDYGNYASGYNVYNAYILPPSSTVDIATCTLNLSSIQPTACDASGNVYAFNITVVNPSTLENIVCKGYTDFTIANGGAKLEDVLLYESPQMQCYETGDCEYQKLYAAVLQGKDQYYQYYNRVKDELVNKMIAHLMDPNNVTENLELEKKDYQYQYTLYSYDRAGNLIRTNPPQGVKPLTTQSAIDNVDVQRSSTSPANQSALLVPNAKASIYKYNSLNQLVEQTTPDGGTTKFYYDSKGRLVLSQNAKQAAKTAQLGGYYYSYTLYDEQSRITETGEVKLSGTGYPLYLPMVILHLINSIEQPDEVTNAVRSSTEKRDVVTTEYDVATLQSGDVQSTDYALSNQDNLRSRVSAVKFFSLVGTIATSNSTWRLFPDYALHYSYDALGNVKTLTHEIKKLSGVKQKFKRIDYDYDQLSGKVNMVSYNRGFSDQFYHRYIYDGDNRVASVETSKDGVVWSRDAAYDYYKHGPLARVRLGEYDVQSTEYAYTLQGWLKAINGNILNPNLEMGKNGIPHPASAIDPISQDAVAHSLDYFDGDYTPIGSTPWPTISQSSTLASTNTELFNGNIARQYTSIVGLSPAPNSDYGMERSYKYDQLNRINEATNAYYSNGTTPALVTTSPSNLYKSTYKYDKDGNILELNRWDNNQQQFDALTYNYNKTSTISNEQQNQLQDVIETASSPAGYKDIAQFMPTSGKTYVYDEIGNLVNDKREGLDLITWNTYGKMSSVKINRLNDVHTLGFMYDGMGNRVVKEDTKTLSSGYDEQNSEYYIRDATGNVLTVYKYNGMYSRYPIFQHVDASAVSASGVVPFAGFITQLGTDEPGFITNALDKAQQIVPSWVTATAADKPNSYYLQNDLNLTTELLSNNEAYLDDLQDFDTSGNSGPFKVGAIVIGNAIAQSKETQVSNFLLQTLATDKSTKASLLHYGRFMPFDQIQELWTRFGYGFNPDDTVGSIESLSTGIIAQSMQSEVAVFMQDQLKRTTDGNLGLYFTSLIADNDIFKETVIRDGGTTEFEAGIMDMINHSGDRGILSQFIAQWSPASQWVNDHASDLQKVAIIYNTEPQSLVTSLLNTSMEPIDKAIAEIPGLTLTDYGNKLDAAGIGPVLLDRNTIIHEELSLAEHHVYGSAHLGIQYYDATSTSDIKNVTDYITPSNNTTNLNITKPWYSYAYGDLVTAGERIPWNKWHSSNNFSSLRLLGMRQYSVSDHLGNVLATVLDRKLGNLPNGATFYDYWKPDIASAQDFYPFGMLMPNRITTANRYRLGYNGIETTNDIGGERGHYSALFGEYDARLARRWNMDPKPIACESEYAMFRGNPVGYSDPLLDYSRFGAYWRSLRDGGSDIYKSGKDWGYNTSSSDGIVGHFGNHRVSLFDNVYNFMSHSSLVAKGEVKFSVGLQAEWKDEIGFGNSNKLKFKVGGGAYTIESDAYGGGVDKGHMYGGVHKTEQLVHNYFTAELGGKVLNRQVGLGYKGDWQKYYYNTYDGNVKTYGDYEYKYNLYVFGKSYAPNKLAPNMLEPSFKVKSGYEDDNKGTFYGMDFGAAAKLLLGVEIKFRVGIYNSD